MFSPEHLPSLPEFLAGLGTLTIVFGLMMGLAGEEHSGWSRRRVIAVVLLGLGLCGAMLWMR